MSDKQRQDASSSMDGIIYQFYIAVDKCFTLKKNESIIVEKFGDVTVSNQTQIEVKHYDNDLTDLHENIWKTIENWLIDSFDVSFYKHFILLTTQNFGANSSFKEWNKKTKTDKQKILTSIHNAYLLKSKKSEKTLKILSSVLDTSKSTKLLDILDKFIILDSSPTDSAYYEELKQVHGKGILEQNQDDFINSLLGYILSPEVRDNEWSITYDMFKAKVDSLTNQYRSGTIIFPSQKSDENIDEDQFSEHLFIKKIEDINHHDVKSEAISDYIQANMAISKELQHHAISKESYNAYEEELKRIHVSAYQEASLGTDARRQIKDSKIFYYRMTGMPAPSFIHFNDTPLYFKNGILHSIADDEEQNIIWKLKVEDE